MTDLKHSILGLLYHDVYHEKSVTDILNLRLAPHTQTKHAIDDLIATKLIARVPCSDKVKLLPNGSQAYEQSEEERRRDAENKKQQRFQNKISYASVLVPIITFLLGVVVEFKTHVADFFIHLFS